MRHDTMASVKAIIAFLILIIAVGIFIMFQVQGPWIAAAGKMPLFRALAIVEGMLLLTLLFLVNNSHHHPTQPASKPKSKTSAKKKK